MRSLIDAMFPPTTCQQLATQGYGTVHVRDRGMDASPDDEVAGIAVRESRVFVTENVKDFARERDLTIVCVLKSRLPAHGMGVRLAAVLDSWAATNPEPYIGLHWPKASP